MAINLNFKSQEGNIKRAVQLACFGNVDQAMQLLQPLDLTDAQKQTVLGYFKEATPSSDALDLQKRVISVVNPEEPFPFLELLPEIQSTALFNLNMKEIIKCSRVCKDMKALIEGDNFSKAVFCRDFKGRFPMTASGFFRACKDSYIFEPNFQNGVYGTRFSENSNLMLSALGAGEIFYSSTKEGNISIWDFDIKTCTSTIKRDKTGTGALKFVNGRFYSGRSHGAIEILDPKLGGPFCTLKVVRAQKEEDSSITALAFDNDGLLYAASPDHTIGVWDPLTGKYLDTLVGHTGRIRGLVFCDGLGVLCSAETEGTIKVWDLQTKICLQTFQAHVNGLTSLVFLGGVLYSSGLEGMIKAWDPMTGECLEDYYMTRGSVFRLISSNGYLCAVYSGGRVIILDPKKLNESKKMKKKYTLESAMNCGSGSRLTSFNGKLCGVSLSDGLEIWDFMEKDVVIFQELAGLLRSGDSRAMNEAMKRFTRMPRNAKNKIYGLCGISVSTSVSPEEQAALDQRAKEQWASLPATQRADAIEAYVKSQE